MTQRSLKLNIPKAELNLPTTTALSLPILVLMNGDNLPMAPATLTIHFIINLWTFLNTASLLQFHLCSLHS